MTEAYGHAVSAHAYRFPLSRIAELLVAAGFAIEGQLVREPRQDEMRPQAYVIRKISAPERA